MTLAKYQFDSADADAILLTTEAGCSTEFHVHRCILAAASPFFSDLFSLPQAEAEESASDEKLPVIPVTESSQVLDTVLRFAYPIPDPIIGSLDELTTVLGVAIKYDLAAATTTLRKLLISTPFLLTSPVSVYAVACRFDLDEEARIASQHTLNTNLLDAPPTEALKYISGYDYHRLLALHQRRSSGALALLHRDIPEDIKCMQCNGSAFTMHGSPKWWHEWEKAAMEELKVRPTTEVVFGMEFLFRAARASGCTRCPESVLDSWKFLRDLREVIDELPAMV